jgi:hypothetical protein
MEQVIGGNNANYFAMHWRGFSGDGRQRHVTGDSDDEPPCLQLFWEIERNL